MSLSVDELIAHDQMELTPDKRQATKVNKQTNESRLIILILHNFISASEIKRV